jgi:hypothetical protein
MRDVMVARNVSGHPMTGSSRMSTVPSNNTVSAHSTGHEAILHPELGNLAATSTLAAAYRHMRPTHINL